MTDEEIKAMVREAGFVPDWAVENCHEQFKRLVALVAERAVGTQPAPSVPARIEKVWSGFRGLFLNEAKLYKRGWNECRAAMLTAAPEAPKRKPLTDEQIDAIMPNPSDFGMYQPPWSGSDITILRAMARAVEAAHGITGDEA